MNNDTAKEILRKVVKDYDKIAEEFDNTRQHNWKEFETFLPYIKDNDKIADLGCGNGRFYKYISAHKKITYTGIEKSKNLLKAAKKQNKAKFIEGDLLSLPLRENSQNVALAIASIHHIPSKKLRNQAIQEMSRILKPKGTLIITAWNLFQPKYKKYIWQSRLKSLLSLGKYDPRDTFIPWNNKAKRYYYAFTQNELRELLTKNGFEIVKKSKGRNFTFICKKS